MDEITDIKFRIYQTTVHSCRFLHTIYRGDEFETKHRIYRIWKYGTGHGRWNACEWNCKRRAAVCLCQAMGKAVVSIAAGMFFETYEQLLPPHTHHLSIIPNMPVSVCEGVILWEQRNSLQTEEVAAVEQLFSAIAFIEKLESDQMTIGATVAGCGPAFAAMFIEALGDGAVAYGLGREAAYRLCAQMMTGTAKQLLVHPQHPGQLKDRVSSPKGTTIQGVAELERLGFRNALISAIERIEQFRLK